MLQSCVEPHILTYTGRRMNPLDLKSSDIEIEDIAHGLACLNRFSGQTKEPINVANHSVYVSRLCDTTAALQGLLHDATEAYLGDVTKWLKASPVYAAYREAEDRAWKVIAARFGVEVELHVTVSAADVYMVRLEATHGFGDAWQTGLDLYQPLPLDQAGSLVVVDWQPLGWERSEQEFLERFKELA